ncbi:MAG: COG4223 family protein [Bradyrhizobium sp.]
MVDDRPDDIGPSPDLGRAKRPPPTIDLEASEVSSEPRNAGDDTQPQHASQEPPSQEPSAHEPSPPQSSSQQPPATAISAWVVAIVSGAVAASLVIGVGWILGWPAIPATPAAGQINSAVIDDLSARIAGAESKASKSATAAADPASAARIEALEKSLASLRGEVATARAQSEKLAAIVNDVKAAPGGSSSPLDLTAINERIAGIERAARAQENATENATPADDVPLRRIVAAALLDVLVRTGDPYPAALTAAKSLATNPDALKPLEGFAAKGVPNANALSRELLTLVPKLSPPAQPDNATTGSGIVERLQAGASKLVRIERTDTVGNDRGAVVARATAAALRNELADARRELNTLAPADRAAAQAWLDKCDARDAALAASRSFAAETMASLAKPVQ